MSKLVYIQHIDSRWIPQRPHFLAQALLRLAPSEAKMHFFHLKSWRRSQLLGHEFNLGKARFQTLYGLPTKLSPVFTYLEFAALFLQSFRFRFRSAEYILLTHPRLYPLVIFMRKPKIIYDCMDDAVAMSTYPRLTKWLEQRLLARASLTIVTSSRLKISLEEKYNCSAVLIPNAPSPTFMIQDSNFKKRDLAIFFGSIGEWIDFGLIQKFLIESGWELEIYGPIHADIPHNLRSFHYGVRSQEYILERARVAKVALLPFELSDFTKTIDPVKFYEYVSLHLPILSTPLESISKFSEFFIPWESTSDVQQILVLANEIYPKNDSSRLHFLQENNWQARAKMVYTEIGKI
jgi:hypothetical protein